MTDDDMPRAELLARAKRRAEQSTESTAAHFWFAYAAELEEEVERLREEFTVRDEADGVPAMIVNPLLIALNANDVTALSKEFRRLIGGGLYEFASAFPRIAELLQDLDHTQREE